MVGQCAGLAKRRQNHPPSKEGGTTRNTYAEPEGGVRVSGEASATSELLLTGGADEDGVLNSAEAGGVEGAHVEDVDALHLTENLETLETGGLLEIGRDGTGGGTRTEEVLLALDLCELEISFSSSLAHSSFSGCR